MSVLPTVSRDQFRLERDREWIGEMISSAAFKPGDRVIYRMTKHSRRPGPRARAVVPASNGDDYCYLVDKFWVVDEVRPDGTLLLRTRRGKTRQVPVNDLNLRAPRWWELLLHRNSFPRFPAPPAISANESASETLMSAER